MGAALLADVLSSIGDLHHAAVAILSVSVGVAGLKLVSCGGYNIV